MRRPYVAGNWKMNLRRQEGLELARAIKQAAASLGGVEVAVFPPFTLLADVAAELRGSPVAVGAQDLHAEDFGAFTGSVSAPMLKDVGCVSVIVGHSERRQLAGDDLPLVRRKLAAALRHGLRPILCVGEQLAQRDRGETERVVAEQVRSALAGSSQGQLAALTIAYEPVWAIGTGRNATAGQAADVHRFIRGLLAELYSREFAEQLRIQYGGSVKPANAAELLTAPDVDGALVGGASLEAPSFLSIVRSGLARSR
ncbi:MAG: triose-phosphate isomerase [Planctomycetota bacterium]